MSEIERKDIPPVDKNRKSALGIDKQRHLMFEKQLEHCEEAFNQRMTPADGTFYRLVGDPTREIDIYPQSLLDYERLTPKAEDIPDTIPKGSGIEEQWTQIKIYSPSFNTTPEGVANKLLPLYNKRKEKQKEAFLMKKGTHIKAYTFNNDDGWMQKVPDSDGHIVIQPYEGFNLDDHEDKSFTPIPLTRYISSNDE